MKLVQRIEHLETASTEAEYRRWAERLAGEWGMPVERAFQKLLEIRDRIERDGLDEELRWLAIKSGHSEEKVREDYEEALEMLPKLGEG